MNEYRFVRKNNIEMLELTAINSTGVAEAFFSTRHGGISEGHCGKMNCNLYKRLDAENGRENFRLFCRAIDVPSERVITNRLNQFTDVCRYVTADNITDIYDEAAAAVADGLITDKNDVTLFMYAADCAIILLLDTERKAIGMLHTGWKGSLNGIMPNTVAAMREHFGTSPETLTAVICPSICGGCFKVDTRVAKLFREKGHDRFISQDADIRIDLNGVNTAVLKSCGLKEENIHNTNLCTCHNEELFHSYRRGPVDENGLHLNGMNGVFFRLL